METHSSKIIGCSGFAKSQRACAAKSQKPVQQKTNMHKTKPICSRRRQLARYMPRTMVTVHALYDGHCACPVRWSHTCRVQWSRHMAHAMAAVHGSYDGHGTCSVRCSRHVLRTMATAHAPYHGHGKCRARWRRHMPRTMLAGVLCPECFLNQAWTH